MSRNDYTFQRFKNKALAILAVEANDTERVNSLTQVLHNLYTRKYSVNAAVAYVRAYEKRAAEDTGIPIAADPVHNDFPPPTDTDVAANAIDGMGYKAFEQVLKERGE